MALAVLSKGLVGIVFPGGGSSTARCAGPVDPAAPQWLFGLLLFFAITAPWFIAVSAANLEFAHYFYSSTIHFRRFLTAAPARGRVVVLPADPRVGVPAVDVRPAPRRSGAPGETARRRDSSRCASRSPLERLRGALLQRLEPKLPSLSCPPSRRSPSSSGASRDGEPAATRGVAALVAPLAVALAWQASRAAERPTTGPIRCTCGAGPGRLAGAVASSRQRRRRVLL